MTTVVWMIGFCAALALIFALASERSSFFITSLKSGAMIWAQVLPIAAIALYYYCVFVNLVGSPLPYKSALSLKPLFSHAELSFFFVAGVALLTRVSSIVAIVLTGYTIQQILFSNLIYQPFAPGVAIFASSLMVLTLLCDCLPWVRDSSQKMLGDKLREIFVLLFSFVAMAGLFACVMKFPEFHRWLANQHVALDAKSKYILMSMVVLFLGWLAVAMGVGRSLLIPVLAIPTIVVMSFLTNVSPTLLSIFFVAIIIASLVNRRVLVLTTTRMTYL